MYDLEYNGINASSLQIFVREKVNIPSPRLKYTENEVQGRDGSLIESDEKYEDITIPVKFNYKTIESNWHEVFRKAKKWLFSNGTKKLIFNDDANYFYLVKRVEIGDNERLSGRIGSFSVNFICEPYQYLISGETEYDISDVLNNPYDECHPVYIVSGHYGSYKLIVNGNTVEVNVSTLDGKTSTPTYIDSEKMMTYTEDGIRNTYLKGDYESLYLQEGENTIETPKSTSGLAQGYTPTVKVIPRWRCK